MAKTIGLQIKKEVKVEKTKKEETPEKEEK